MTAPRVMDYSVAAEGPVENLRQALMLIGGLRRALQVSGLDAEDSTAMLAGITRRIGLALDQLNRTSPLGSR